jgi:hypothetical protein
MNDKEIGNILNIFSIEIDYSPVFYFNIVMRNKVGAPVETIKVKPDVGDKIYENIVKEWWKVKLENHIEKGE